ncbi:MAG: family 20 glycosylhydrolase [bacterium]
MQKTIRYILTITFLACAPLTQGIDSSDLLPRPQTVEMSPGAFRLNPGKIQFLLIAETEAAVTRLSKHLHECLSNLNLYKHKTVIETSVGKGFVLAVSKRSPQKPKKQIALPEQAQSEGYALTVTKSNITIQADSECGLFYGLMTLEQILTAPTLKEKGTIRCMRIIDWPAIPMRGYSEDYGRNQVPRMEDHKRSIRTLARFKMNTYLFFIEPDHFVYNFDPEIGTQYDRFSFEEIRELVRYAKEYHITVIPTVELLAHMEQLLSHPKYAHLAEVEGGGDLCPTCDEAFDLVKKIVGEVSDAFDSPYFHCGLDESFAIGKGRSKEAVEKLGLEKVIGNYYIRMNDLIKSHNKTMMMYADIALKYPGILDLLPRDINMMFWEYTPRDHYQDIDTLVNAGFQVTTLSSLWDWNNLYPIYPRALKNMDAMAAQAAEYKVLGHFVSSWGDPYRGAAGTNLSEWNNYGVAYCGAVSWNPQPIPAEEFSKPFALHFFKSNSDSLAKALTLLAECQGERRNYARYFFHTDPVENIKAMAKINEDELTYWDKVHGNSGIAHEILQQTQPGTNADYLRTIDLSARLLYFTADMAYCCRQLAENMARPPIDTEHFAKSFEKIAERQQELWQDYRETYATTNRPINLRHIQKIWDSIHEQLLTLGKDLRSGKFPPKE